MAGQIPAKQRFANGTPTPALAAGVTLDPRRVDLSSHGGPGATPRSEQKFQTKWTKNKKTKEHKRTKTKKTWVNETSEAPSAGQPH
jgi:hypothetical protein